MMLLRELNERGSRARFLLPVVAALALCSRPAFATSVVVGDTVYFSRSSVQLSGEGEETLRRQAAWLNEHPGVTVTIEGHTDSWGSRTQNMALGQRRAEEVRRFLISLGLAASRVTTVSYGEDRPKAVCRMEQCWSINRRAVTVIVTMRSPSN